VNAVFRDLVIIECNLEVKGNQAPLLYRQGIDRGIAEVFGGTDIDIGDPTGSPQPDHIFREKRLATSKKKPHAPILRALPAFVNFRVIPQRKQGTARSEIAGVCGRYDTAHACPGQHLLAGQFFFKSLAFHVGGHWRHTFVLPALLLCNTQNLFSHDTCQ
jgi:hypothetical protein